MNFLFDSFFEKLKFFKVHFGNFCRCQSGTTLRKLGTKKVPQIKIAVLIRYLTHKRRYKLGIGLPLLVIRIKPARNQLAQPVSIISQGEIIRFPLCSFTQYMQVQAKNEKEK